MKNLDSVTDPEDVSTKSYVDNRTPQITVSDVAPSSPAVGDIWVDLLDSESTPAEPGAWVRPADWLPLPEASNSFVGLMAVWDDGGNYVALSANGAFTVNWGDGTAPENYSSGATAYHKFVYTDLAADTLCSRGYRQAIVTVAPQGGQTFTVMSLNKWYGRTGLSTTYSTGWLDVDIDGASLTSVQLSVSTGNTSSVRHFLLEQVRLRANAITNMSYFFSKCYSLQSLPVFNTDSITNAYYMFDYCYSLRSVPLFNTAKVTSTSYMFNNCTSLTSVPLFDTALVTVMEGMFAGCHNLQSVPLFNTSKVTSMLNMFYGCATLKVVPLFDISKVTTTRGMFYSCRTLSKVPLLDTAAVTDMNAMFFSCESLHLIPAMTAAAVTSAGNLSNMFNSCNTLTKMQMTGFKYTFSLTSSEMEAAELNAVYQGLAAGVTGQTIDVTGNPGVDGDDPSIATVKGWTVTGS